MIREKIENWILKSDMKEEAIHRLEMFNIQPNGINIVSAFKKGKIYTSYPDRTIKEIEDGVKCFNLATKEEMQVLKELQEKKDCIIYHIVKQKIGKEQIYYYLFVGQNKYDWKFEYHPILSSESLEINAKAIGIESEYFKLNPNNYHSSYERIRINKFSDCLIVFSREW